MKAFILTLTLLVALAVSAFAQVTTLAVDIDRATLSWNWSVGTGSPVEEFRVKCGPSTGSYTITHIVADPAARSVPVKDLITNAGTYFCAVSAANAFGESALSNEISFDTGSIPLPPTNLKVSAQ